MDIGTAVRAVHRLGPARIDHDELRALADAAFHHRAEHGMALGGIRADDHDDVRLQHRIEVLARGACTHRGRKPELSRRVADSRTVVDVVVAERGAHEFLRQEDFLVRATRARHAAHGAAAVSGLYASELACGMSESLVPADLLPGLIDTCTDHRRLDPVRMPPVVVGEPALHAAVTVVGLAFLPRRHPHDLLADGFRLETAAYAAVGTDGDRFFLWLAWVRHVHILPETGSFRQARDLGRPERRRRN